MLGGSATPTSHLANAKAARCGVLSPARDNAQHGLQALLDLVVVHTSEVVLQPKTGATLICRAAIQQGQLLLHASHRGSTQGRDYGDQIPMPWMWVSIQDDSQ